MALSNGDVARQRRIREIGARAMYRLLGTNGGISVLRSTRLSTESMTHSQRKIEIINIEMVMRYPFSAWSVDEASKFEDHGLYGNGTARQQAKSTSKLVIKYIGVSTKHGVTVLGAFCKVVLHLALRTGYIMPPYSWYPFPTSLEQN